MLVLPPTPKARERFPLRGIIGPQVTITQVDQRLRELIRRLELGELEPPELVVCAQTNRLVLLEAWNPDDSNFKAWLIYQVGSFSTCPVKLLTLSARERSQNNQLIQTRGLGHLTALTQLLQLEGEEGLEPPRPEEEEEDDWLPEEEEEEREDDQDR